MQGLYLPRSLPCFMLDKLPLCLRRWRRCLLRLALAYGVQMLTMLHQVVQQPRLREARILAARRDRLEMRALELQRREAALMAAAGTSGPARPRNLVPTDDQDLRRPFVEHRGRSKFLAPVLRTSPTCQHTSTKHGANAQWSWTKCETCGSTEMVPKLTLDRLTEWNSILVHQKPDHVTPQKKKDDAKNKKETSGNLAKSSSETPRSMSITSRATNPMSSLEAAAMAFRGQAHAVYTPPVSSGEDVISDQEMDEMALVRRDVQNWEKEVDNPMWTQACPQCSGTVHLMWDASRHGYLWQCRKGAAKCPYRWADLEEQITPAFGTRLCTECQQDGLAKVNVNGRWGWKCPRCKDFTLEMDWPGQ